MRILLCTIDLHGYDDAYFKAVSSLGFQVDLYTGLRRYNLATRARRVAAVKVPNMFGARRDRNYAERQIFRRWVLDQDLRGNLVLFVNGHQLATSDLLEEIKRAGAKTALWLLDEVNTLPTQDLDFGHFDFLASFHPGDAKSLQRSTGQCLFVPQGFDDSLDGRIGRAGHLTSLLFIASPGERRQSVVRELTRANVPLELVGQYWPQVMSDSESVKIAPRDVDRLEAHYMYTNSRPCLNIHNTPNSGVNPRTFEVAGAGGLLISDNIAVEEFFDAESEALTWTEAGQVADYAERIGTDHEWVRRIAEAGMRRARSDHSLRSRFAGMFDEWGIS